VDWTTRLPLIDTLGFRPGFIRIRACRFPGDPDFCPYRGHEHYWDLLGVPDSDDEESWLDEPRGNGGRISWLVRKGEYVIGGDWWADKEGHVHST
jgi:hypothetical protein